MKEDLRISVRFTLVTTMLLGLTYPLVVTGLARTLFPRQAKGSLLWKDGKAVGSSLIGQPFSSPGYFRPRPSAVLYDAGASGGSNLGPTNRVLIERVWEQRRNLWAENPQARLPVDLLTTSASGLDPHISPAAAEFQIPRVTRERGVSEQDVWRLVSKHTEGRTWGLLGEPRVNVLELNLDLDAIYPRR